jgi:CheY-like chemotaxis protein
MHVREWTVCVIEPNRFEAQILVDVLRGAGVEKIKFFTDSAEAMSVLETFPANIIVAAVESLPTDGVAWTRALRRNHQVKNRKASVFLTSRAFSRNLAEDCRHAGANALIGKPISAKILTATITKVLNNPRPFIDAPNYVGPCRRAGIVTAGEPKKRRKADESAAAPQGATLLHVLVGLAQSVDAMLDKKGDPAACEAALKRVQSYAVTAGDGQMMRACAAMTLQLQSRDMRPEIAREALGACVEGMKELAALDMSDAAARNAAAEGVRLAVAKAAAKRAA